MGLAIVSVRGPKSKYRPPSLRGNEPRPQTMSNEETDPRAGEDISAANFAKLAEGIVSFLTGSPPSDEYLLPRSQSLPTDPPMDDGDPQPSDRHVHLSNYLQAQREKLGTTIHGKPNSAQSSPGPQIATSESDVSDIPIQNDTLRFEVSVDQDEEFDATTCWIAAEQALHHVRTKALELAHIFTRRGIPQTEYAVLAGFDESLIRAGVGYLEQIHLFLSDKVDPASDLLMELERIFSPFSSILFTQSSSHTISLPNNIPNPWECGELPPPTMISVASQTAGAVDGPSVFSNVDSGNENGGESEKRSSEKDKERDDRDSDERDKAGDHNKVPPELSPERDGSESSGCPRITFEINSEIRSINNVGKPIQTLTMQGALTIKTTSLDSQTPERRIQFEELKFDADPPGMEYKQSSVRVIVDSNSKTARSKALKPWSTPGYDRKETESSATTKTHASIRSAAVTAGPNPTGTIGFSSTHTRAVAHGSEKQRNTSRISQQGRSGSVRWTFRIDDPNEQEEGIKMHGESDILPAVTFEFFESSLPKHADVEIMSCWSLLPDTSPATPSNWFLSILQKFFRSSDGTQTPSYSNLCQITALETIPSALPSQSRYVATLKPVREVTGYSHFTKDNIEVLQDIDPSIIVKPDINSELGVMHHTDPSAVDQPNPNLSLYQGKDRVANNDSNKKFAIKLPKITKVRFPENPEQVLENMGSSRTERR